MHFFMVLALLHRVESYYQGIRYLPVSSLKHEEVYSTTIFKSHHFIYLFLIYTFTAGPGATSSITCAQILMTFSR